MIDDETAAAAQRARAGGQMLRELTATLDAKRKAYEVVARMIAECRRARSGEMWGPNALIPPGEALVLRELEAIETAMRAASQVK